MVLILDNSSADIAIVMPKPDLTKDQFSYSNLYSFDYDGAAAGVNGASVESSTSSMSGHAGSDDDSVSVARFGCFHILLCSFSHCLNIHMSNI